jgi:hypothetical protein
MPRVMRDRGVVKVDCAGLLLDNAVHLFGSTHLASNFESIVRGVLIPIAEWQFAKIVEIDICRGKR